MKSNLFAITLLALSATACADMDPSDQDQAGVEPDKVSVNSLLPGNIASSNLGAAALTPAAVDQIATTANGRSFLSYLVGCGLTSSQTLTTTAGYTFTGSVGIQSLWATRPLSMTDRALISACVLARTNYYGQPVSISMRAASATLATTQDEVTNYTLEEGAFYGDILSGGTPKIHTCSGVAALKEKTLGDMQYRICAESTGGGSTACNFTWDGACSDVCTTSVGSAGYWDNCNGYANVLTTFVQD